MRATKADLQTLAQLRLDDAILLFEARRYSSAYYLVGYAVELSLKACIAASFQADVIPDKAYVAAIYTHKLDSLMNIAGLQVEFKKDSDADEELAAAWGVTSKWTEESRYQLWDEFSTASMVEAISNQEHGIYAWVKKHW